MRIISFLLVLLMLSAMVHAEPLQSASQHIYIVDYQTGTVIADKGGREKIHPASMSKLMTIYMLFDTLKKGNIKLTDTMHVSQKAWSTQGSKMFVEIDGNIKVEDLIRGIIIQSGNDACVVVAEGLAGSEEAFAEQMNRKAAEIGLEDSHFVNASGLPDANHLMSARDLAILARRLMDDFPEYYHYFSEKEFTYHGIKQGNRNPLLYRNGSGVDGLKTGHTEEAGFGLTASANRNGRRIIMVVHGLGNMQQRADEAGQVLDWAYRTTENYKLAAAGQALAESPVWLGADKTVPVGPLSDIIVTLQRDAKQSVTAKIKMDKEPEAPLKAGTHIGTLVLSAGNQEMLSVPIVTLKDISKLGPWGRFRANLSHLVLGAN